MNPVAAYCKAFAAAKAADASLSPTAFAYRMLARDRTLCMSVLDYIGCFPSSEPELRALQRVA